jgi:DNA (cytosine-5)-methyltransferase 1
MSVRPTVVSLFSGALGLDLGLERAGFELRLAVECNKFAAQTIKNNRPDVPLIEKRIEEIETKEMLERAGLKAGEVTLITGGPSCQSFSTAGQRGSVTDPRGGMFREFSRVIREAKPRFFIMENVRGVLSAAVKHRPLNKRGPGFPALTSGEELGSALKVILAELRTLRYYVVFDIVNAADYGVPQARERVIFLGSRDGEPIEIPPPTHARKKTATLKRWVNLREGLRDLDDPKPVFHELPPGKRKYLKHVPSGGNWKDLPVHMQKKALGKAYVSWGGRVGFFRRLAWNRPSPALTTRPDSKATMFCHPIELRPLSVGEYGCIQGFPPSWKFGGGPPQHYIQIGNAVPIKLGEALGNAVRSAMKKRRRLATGVVVCARAELLDRMANRPRTILNPPRMRRYKKTATARRWLKGARRGEIRQLVVTSSAAAKVAARKRTKPHGRTTEKTTSKRRSGRYARRLAKARHRGR